MKPSPLRPSLRDLAAAANLSASTISLALRNHPRIPASTRERVHALAREMHYRPNPAVVALMGQIRTKRTPTYRETLGWINAHDREDYFTAPNLTDAQHGRKLWEGARERAQQLGYRLEMFWAKEPGMTAKRMSRILASRGIRGLLIPPLPKACGHLSIDWSGFAVTTMSFTIARPQLHRVVPDHHHNMQMILRTLRHRGYRRPGLIIPTRYDERVQNRSRAAFYFHQQMIPAIRRVPVLICASTFEKPCASWLKKYRPDAIVAWAGFRGVRNIDIGDAGYSRRLGVALMAYGKEDAGFAAVDENPRQIGSTAVDHLASQLSRGEVGIPKSPQTLLIQGTWVEGKTLVPL